MVKTFAQVQIGDELPRSFPESPRVTVEDKITMGEFSDLEAEVTIYFSNGNHVKGFGGSFLTVLPID